MERMEDVGDAVLEEVDPISDSPPSTLGKPNPPAARWDCPT